MDLDCPGLSGLPAYSAQVQWCHGANQITDQEILEALAECHDRARLIENPVSFVSYSPVMDALRSLWTPGCPMKLPFAKTLMTGEQDQAADAEAFGATGAALGIPASLDKFQVCQHICALNSNLRFHHVTHHCWQMINPSNP